MSEPATEPTDPDLRFQTLFEQAPFSVQLIGADGCTLRVNKAWETLWQVAEGDGLKAYVLGEYNMLADPQLAAKGIADILKRAFAGESVQLPLIAYDPAELGKPGHIRWVRANAHPILSHDGSVREVMLIHEDVTDQVQAEQALRASEERLKQLANTIPQLVWMADSEGSIHWYNERWYDYTGTTPQDMIGWGWQSVHDPELLPQVVERWEHSVQTGEPFQMSFPLRGRDGRFRPFFTLVAPLKDAAGKVVQWFGTNTDVSALHQAEEGLRQAEERLRLAVDAGGIGIWDWDVTRDAVTWSDNVYRLHEMAPGSFGGTVADFTALVHPDDREGVRNAIESALATKDMFSTEFRALLADGRVKWMSAQARVDRDAGGQATRLLGASISVDAYKKAEAALREGDRRKDEFLAMLAHELRNPLAPISTAAALLQASAGDEARVRRASEIIARQVKHVAKLVDDLLDASRITRGLAALDKQELDLKLVLDHAIEQARPLIESSRHAFKTWFDAQPAFVHGDSTRLVQAIVNLLSNAARYTPAGGVITLELRVIGAQAHIHVIDNGSGIEPELQSRVFELFTQGPRTSDRSQGGLGIGLALVKGIVELHDGQVRVHSDGLGTGSTFTLVLPLAAHTETAEPLRPVAAVFSPAIAQALKLLVVDDNRDAAQSLQMLLQSAGHQVVVRHDARSALDALEQGLPQVFILDIGLPDMDGYELAERLRAQAGGGLFIALTGYGQAKDRERSKAAGFDHHFVKPVDVALLVGVLSKVG